VARHGDILRPGRQRELEIGCVSLHAAFRGKRSGHAGGTGGGSARPRRVLCMSSLDPPVEWAAGGYPATRNDVGPHPAGTLIRPPAGDPW